MGTSCFLFMWFVEVVIRVVVVEKTSSLSKLISADQFEDRRNLLPWEGKLEL